MQAPGCSYVLGNVRELPPGSKNVREREKVAQENNLKIILKIIDKQFPICYTLIIAREHRAFTGKRLRR